MLCEKRVRASGTAIRVIARPLRIEYPGAIHHVMSRGNLRRSVFEGECDYQRLFQGPGSSRAGSSGDTMLISSEFRYGVPGTGEGLALAPSPGIWYR